MATLIQEISWSAFKKLVAKSTADQFRALKSFEVLADGEYVFTAQIARTNFIQIQTEYNAQLSNSIGGEEPNKQE